MSRRPPLHTIGASILTIVHNACSRARDVNGPVGSLTRRATIWMSSCLPFIYTMQYQWLAILLFADDYILTVENMVEKIFPPSVCFFDGIDRLVCRAESLPKQLDDALNNMPKFAHSPFLDWALVALISWLNFLISTLTLLGLKGTKEKEIMVDANSDNPRTTLEGVDSRKQKAAESGVENSNLAPGNGMKKGVGMKQGVKTMKCSYKEILEKGRKEEEEGGNKQPGSTISEEREMEEVNRNGKGPFAFNLNDPILELYEASWHLK